MNCETDATETTICSFRREVSATFTAICEDGSRVVSCVKPRRSQTVGSGPRKVRGAQERASDSFTLFTVSRRVRERSRKGGSHVIRHTGNCALQLVSGLAGWYEEPRPSNAKWCKEWKGTEWSDVDLTDPVRPTLEGLILTCCDADGTLFCVVTRADGRKMCENKDILLVESEHHIAQLCSSTVIGEKLKSSSATVCPTEADSKYLVETASVFAEYLGGDCMPVLSAWMARHATWSMSRFQVKSESRTALPRVLENCWIQDRIESATEVASKLRQRAWITTRYREECEKRANSMQALDNAKTDGNALGYMKVSETDECEIEDDAEYQVSEVGKSWTTRDVIQTMHEHRWLSPALVERNDFEDETCTKNLWPLAACAATFALTDFRAVDKRGCWIWYVFPQFLDSNRDSINNWRFQLRSRTEAKEFLTHSVLGPRYMEAVKCATVAIAAQDVNKVMGWAVDSKKFHQSVTVLQLATAEAGLEEEERILCETLRHERDRTKHVRCRDDQSRGGPIFARDGPGNWTSRTLKAVCETDTSAGQENGGSEANNLIFIWNVTSHADETEIMGGDCSVSNTAAYDCRMLVLIRGNSDTIDDNETGRRWSLRAW